MSPSANDSSCPGVLVTPSQFLPPMMGKSGVPSSCSYRFVSNCAPPNSGLSCSRTHELLVPAGMIPVTIRPSAVSTHAPRGTSPCQPHPLVPLLVRIHDPLEVNGASRNRLSQNRHNPILRVSDSSYFTCPSEFSSSSSICHAYSGGLAGSMMKASLDLSSTTRYA